MTDGNFPTSSRPSFGKLKKQFEELRHRLEELGSLCKQRIPFHMQNNNNRVSMSSVSDPSFPLFLHAVNHQLLQTLATMLWLPFDPLHCLVNLHEAGVDWIIHLDTDELMHPAGTSEYSLRRLLADIPEDVDMVIFPNYESSVERDDVKEPFSEVRYLFTVSMFKKNYDHLAKEMYFGNYKEATRGNPNYFLTYGNGKSAARVQVHLRSNGAHRWHNYMKSPKYACSACYLFSFYLYFVSYLFRVLQKDSSTCTELSQDQALRLVLVEVSAEIKCEIALHFPM
ncbi:hypothetical protein MTR67_026648 [Solanum verrucosum]|uniref:Glycosyltransferase family 92 protein n=1 Tax=Solanum verrucosum TaxID=315347 RepID=A0AAF0TZU7_SOLVR|nr:hypothetical protein MTR67_026648 [Solanum verrucosum]